MSNSTFPKQTFFNVFPRFKYLRSLNISNMEFVTDEFAALVGRFGLHLLELDISYTRITDRGIKAIVVQNCNVSGVCQKLVKLNIDQSDITCEGACAALSNLKKLIHLQFEHTAQSVYLVLQEIPDSKFKLSRLEFNEDSDGTLSDQVFAAVVIACPNAQTFSFNAFGKKSEEFFLPLTEVKELRVLQIKEHFRRGIEPHPILNSLWPVLIHNGETLLDLELSSVTDINVPLLLKFCPNLKKLSLINNSNYHTDLPLAAAELKKLNPTHHEALENVKLSSDGTSENDFLVEDLTLLLSSPRLKRFEIYSSQNFNDDLMENLVQSDFLSSLQTLEIGNCNDFTTDHILPLLLNNSSLRIHFEMCRYVGKYEYDRFKGKCNFKERVTIN